MKQGRDDNDDNGDGNDVNDIRLHLSEADEAEAKKIVT